MEYLLYLLVGLGLLKVVEIWLYLKDLLVEWLVGIDDDYDL